MNLNQVRIGNEIVSSDDVCINTKELAKHFGCFGASGSGKTVSCKVLIEELAIQGIPGIIIDPKGDLSSLAQLATNQELEKYGVDKSIQEQFKSNVEVIIWTPGSDKGIPLSISPLKFDDIHTLDEEEKKNYYNDVAINMISLMGYDIEADSAKSGVIVLSEIINYCIYNNKPINSVDHLINHLIKLPKSISKEISLVSNPEDINKLILRLRLLKKGANNQLFNKGYPLDIDMLLGNNLENGKTRLSIIYLNTISNQEGKEFFISLVAQKLYLWAKNNPKKKDQSLKCSFFIDEVHPFLPPVRRPICKEYLLRCVKEFRGYGIACLLATQNIAGVDYHAFGNFGTYNFGKFTASQDIDRIKHILESKKEDMMMNVISTVPTMGTGEFLLVPSINKEIFHYKVRGLVTSHYILTVEDVKRLTLKRMRDKIKVELGNSGKVSASSNTAGMVKNEIKETNQENNVKNKTNPEILLKQTSNQVKEVIEVDTSDNENQINVINQKIFGNQLNKILSPILKSGFSTIKEIKSSKLNYIPIAKASFTFSKETGFFRKKKNIVSESLYLNLLNDNYIFMHCNNYKFEFDSIISSDPDEIKDLDGICEIKKMDITEFDDYVIKHKDNLNKKKLKQIVETNYNVNLKQIDFVLFPYWECTLFELETNETEKIFIDAILGKPILLNEIGL